MKSTWSTSFSSTNFERVFCVWLQSSWSAGSFYPRINYLNQNKTSKVIEWEFQFSSVKSYNKQTKEWVHVVYWLDLMHPVCMAKGSLLRGNTFLNAIHPSSQCRGLGWHQCSKVSPRANLEYGASCLLPFPYPTTNPLTNLSSTNLIASSSLCSFLLFSFFLC